VSAFPGWQYLVLYLVGAPLNEHNAKFLDGWHRAEGGRARFNPLNTTQPWPGATNFNSAGVKSYKTRRNGVDATVKTLKNGNYNKILRLLRKGNAGFRDLADAVDASPWGTDGSVIKQVLGVA
jgi:hypothetical protein